MTRGEAGVNTTILDHFEDMSEFEDVLAEAESNALTQTEMEFVDDLSNKFTQFAENTYCSDRQAEFLRKIARR